MATVKVTLKQGLTVGEARHIEAELREATAGDMIEACLEAERLVETFESPQLVSSPTLVGLHTLRRQIVRIGDCQGPLTLAELKKLTTGDLSLLQEKALDLEAASLQGVASRGRD